jgi:hypothetical protein
MKDTTSEGGDILHEYPNNQSILLQYIIDLTDKYEKLEQKVNKMQKTAFQLRKKNVDEYIKCLSPCILTFNEWMQNCVVTEKALQVLFDKDIKDCLKTMIYQTIEASEYIPIKAFTQRPNTIFIYDKTKEGLSTTWRPITHDELEQFTRILGHRIFKKYLEWTRENSIKIEQDNKLQELSMIYMNKANGSSTSFEQRITEVRKAIIANVQVSLKNLE